LVVGKKLKNFGRKVANAGKKVLKTGAKVAMAAGPALQQIGYQAGGAVGLGLQAAGAVAGAASQACKYLVYFFEILGF
jgi:hypothetical protein